MPMERPIDITAPKKDTEMKVLVDEFPMLYPASSAMK